MAEKSNSAYTDHVLRHSLKFTALITLLVSLTPAAAFADYPCQRIVDVWRHARLAMHDGKPVVQNEFGSYELAKPADDEWTRIGASTMPFPATGLTPLSYEIDGWNAPQPIEIGLPKGSSVTLRQKWTGPPEEGGQLTYSETFTIEVDGRKGEVLLPKVYALFGAYPDPRDRDILYLLPRMPSGEDNPCGNDDGAGLVRLDLKRFEARLLFPSKLSSFHAGIWGLQIVGDTAWMITSNGVCRGDLSNQSQACWSYNRGRIRDRRATKLLIGKSWWPQELLPSGMPLPRNIPIVDARRLDHSGTQVFQTDYSSGELKGFLPAGAVEPILARDPAPGQPARRVKDSAFDQFETAQAFILAGDTMSAAGVLDEIDLNEARRIEVGPWDLVASIQIERLLLDSVPEAGEARAKDILKAPNKTFRAVKVGQGQSHPHALLWFAERSDTEKRREYLERIAKEYAAAEVGRYDNDEREKYGTLALNAYFATARDGAEAQTLVERLIRTGAAEAALAQAYVSMGHRLAAEQKFGEALAAYAEATKRKGGPYYYESWAQVAESHARLIQISGRDPSGSSEWDKMFGELKSYKGRVGTAKRQAEIVDAYFSSLKTDAEKDAALARLDVDALPPVARGYALLVRADQKRMSSFSGKELYERVLAKYASLKLPEGPTFGERARAGTGELEAAERRRR